VIRGVGLDVVDIKTFAEQIEDPASHFISQVFTMQEQTDCLVGPDRVRSLAARWAAKEAFVKAWSSGRRGEAPAQVAPRWQEIEVALDPWHRPTLLLHGETARLCGRNRCHLSMSHDGGTAAAVVILEDLP
jgi:holo-[acyl-carrier protein] synthase